MKIAVIPARGGSKRIPKKNIKNFCGKPMIRYSIEAAQKSNIFDRIIVSTDDEEIMGISKAAGAEVPFIRPDELSDDHIDTAPIIAHAIHEIASEHEIEAVCCIYATAPFIQAEYIVQGYNKLFREQAEYVFTVTTFPFPIFRAIHLDENEHIGMFWPEHLLTRSQDLPEAYHDAGQFYWGTPTAWLEEKAIFAKHSLPIILPRHMVQDIDTQEDWERAELMYKAYIQHHSS